MVSTVASQHEGSGFKQGWLGSFCVELSLCLHENSTHLQALQLPDVGELLEFWPGQVS